MEHCCENGIKDCIDDRFRCYTSSSNALMFYKTFNKSTKLLKETNSGWSELESATECGETSIWCEDKHLFEVNVFVVLAERSAQDRLL